MAKIKYRTSLPIGTLLQYWLQQNRLSAQFSTRLIFRAWDEASGAAPFTVKRFFRDGKLYITVNSSVVRSQLYFQKNALLDRINAIVRGDELSGLSSLTENPVKELIIK